MAPKRVWVKLRGSERQAFKVDVDEEADFDDLKKAIKQEKTVEVDLIFTEEDREARSLTLHDASRRDGGELNELIMLLYMLMVVENVFGVLLRRRQVVGKEVALFSLPHLLEQLS